MTSAVRDRPAVEGTRIPVILPCRGRRRAPVRPSEPVGQQACGFIRGAAVERHERGRHAGEPNDVGAPSILGYQRDLDGIRVACDRFVETVNEIWHGRRRKMMSGSEHSCAAARRDQAKAGAKARPQSMKTRILAISHAIFFFMSIPAQVIHRTSTGFQHSGPMVFWRRLVVLRLTAPRLQVTFEIQ